MAVIPKSGEPIGTTPDGRPVYMSKTWYSQIQQLFGSASPSVAGTTGTMPGNFTAAPAADTRHSNTDVKAWLALEFSDIAGSLSYSDITGTFTITDVLCGVIDVVENKEYVILVNSPFAFNIVSVTTRAVTGSCTMVTKKSTTAIAGLSNAVSTSGVVTTPSGSASFAVSDEIRLAVSANSACEGLSFTIKITRDIP